MIRMKLVMNTYKLNLFILLIFLSLITPANALSNPSEPTTYTTILIMENGDANFSLMLEYQFSSESDAFDFYNSQLVSRTQMSRELEKEISEKIYSISNKTSFAYNFQLDIAMVSDKKVRFNLNYLVKNYLENVTEGWKIGRFFEGLKLGKDDGLEIILPTNFTANKINPAPKVSQNNILRWIGPETFKNGEPTIILRKKTFLDDNILYLLGTGIIIFVVLALKFIRNKPAGNSTTVKKIRPNKREYSADDIIEVKIKTQPASKPTQSSLPVKSNSKDDIIEVKLKKK